MIEFANAVLLAIVSTSLFIGALVHGWKEPAFSALLAAIGLYMARLSLYWLDRGLWAGSAMPGIVHPWLVFTNTLILASIIALAAWERSRL